MSVEETIQALRLALEHSPDNVPLRMHLAATLASHQQFDLAEQEYREALKVKPNDEGIKLALAGVYAQCGKASQALVLLEALCQRPDSTGAAHLAFCKALIRQGEFAPARDQYHQAITRQPGLVDKALEDQLGISSAASTYDDEDDEERDDANEVVGGRIRQAQSDKSGKPWVDVERPRITFADVGGMDSVRDEISIKILQPLKHPELYAAYGKKIGGGILMYGPPGCGKTYLARATAGEIGAGFISVGISEVLDMWIGQSERNLAAIFDSARRNQPCVLFFDEVDALGGRRSDQRGGAGRQMVNQFLSEMDGVEKSNEGVLILAATNAPWHIDPAFRRPGRFDRVLFVPPPDDKGVKDVLRVLLQGKPQKDVDHAKIAKSLSGFSGADVKAVVDLAVEAKLREAIRTGVPAPLSTRDLLDAANSVKPSTREWFASAKNYALYANQGGIYDDVLKYLKL